MFFIKALSQFSWRCNLALYLFKIHFHIHIFTPFSSSNQNLVYISYLPHACNVSCTFNWTWSSDINEVSETFKTMLLIVQFSPSVCYFIPLLHSLVSKAKPKWCQADRSRLRTRVNLNGKFNFATYCWCIKVVDWVLQLTVGCDSSHLQLTAYLRNHILACADIQHAANCFVLCKALCLYGH